MRHGLRFCSVIVFEGEISMLLLFLWCAAGKWCLFVIAVPAPRVRGERCDGGLSIKSDARGSGELRSS